MILSFVETIRNFELLGDRKSERIQHQRVLKRVKRVLRTIVGDIPLEGGGEEVLRIAAQILPKSAHVPGQRARVEFEAVANNTFSLSGNRISLLVSCRAPYPGL